MKIVGVGFAGLLAVVVLLVGVIFGASELGGEVVVLRTRDGSAAVHETSLWVIEEGESLWLRAGDPSSGWLARLRANPEVELERAGEAKPYRANVVPERSEWLNGQLAERYGWADWVIDTTLGGRDATAVRLDPQS